MQPDGETLWSFAALRDTGLLWLINREVLHPRGFSLAIDQDADGNAMGWRLTGDGSQPFDFGPEVDQADRLTRVKSLFSTTVAAQQMLGVSAVHLTVVQGGKQSGPVAAPLVSGAAAMVPYDERNFASIVSVRPRHGAVWFGQTTATDGSHALEHPQ
jgi:hypothetical protein